MHRKGIKSLSTLLVSHILREDKWKNDEVNSKNGKYEEKEYKIEKRVGSNKNWKNKAMVIENDSFSNKKIWKYTSCILTWNILNKNNISFDEVHLNWGGDTYNFKTKLFEEKIEELGVHEFIMYDDRHEHLVRFHEWAEQHHVTIKVVDVVKKEETIY